MKITHTHVHPDGYVDRLKVESDDGRVLTAALTIWAPDPLNPDRFAFSRWQLEDGGLVDHHPAFAQWTAVLWAASYPTREAAFRCALGGGPR